MKKFVVLVAFLALTACDVPPEMSYMTTMPTAWSAEDKASFAAAPTYQICNFYRNGLSGGKPYSQADFKVFEPEFRRRGLTNRDIELVRERAGAYGTGQTFLGLQCSLGFNLSVNKSFYQGVGHRWQVVTPYSYIYLQGDGTDRGMRVTGWN